MTHIHVLKQKDKEVFIYDLVELSEWYTHGYETGINGKLPYEKTETHIKYFGFGSIEKPNTECEYLILSLEEVI